MNFEVKFRTAILVLAALFTAKAGSETITLPRPTRTVFKCTVAGKVIYTDEPCEGAKVIDVEPTRGMNKSSGRELIGKDVAREHQREAFANAVKPVTGMESKQFETETHRVNLPSPIQQECKGLDKTIPKNESAERLADPEIKKSIQQRLFQDRRRYRKLQC